MKIVIVLCKYFILIILVSKKGFSKIFKTSKLKLDDYNNIEEIVSDFLNNMIYESFQNCILNDKRRVYIIFNLKIEKNKNPNQ